MAHSTLGSFTLENASHTPRLFPTYGAAVKAGKNPWCGDYTQSVVGPEFKSLNQNLVGKRSNPRTRVAPVIAPRSYDSEYWRKDEFNKYPSIVNRPSQQDLYLSGYVSLTDPCRSTVRENFALQSNPRTVNVSSHYDPFVYTGTGRETMLANAETTAKENVERQFARQLSAGPISDPSVVNGEFIENTVTGAAADPFRSQCQVPVTDPSFTNEDFKRPCNWSCRPDADSAMTVDETPVQSDVYADTQSRLSPCAVRGGDIVENFEYGEENATYDPKPKASEVYHRGQPVESPSYPLFRDGVVKEETDVGPGFVNTACGYKPGNIAHGLPVNQCTGPAQLDQGYINYNNNKNTQIVQPGTYYRSQVLDPINANIGISHSQQFAPQTAVSTGPGEVVYTDYDAKQFTGVAGPVEDTLTGEELHNIYDPRYTGYASNDRYYIDTMTGQPRFFYDDIDAVKRPSYIVRSNVDHLSAFEQTGAMRPDEIHGDYRHIANREFTESTLDQRTDVQTKLAQMNYARTEQRRSMPLSNTGRMRGR